MQVGHDHLLEEVTAISHYHLEGKTKMVMSYVLYLQGKHPWTIAHFKTYAAQNRNSCE